jgi:Transmembrane secretion effector
LQQLPSQAKGVPVWAPFSHRTFAVIWLATVVSNVGAWMYNVATGWLMVGLDANPLTVSLVQVANTLPMFLFAIAFASTERPFTLSEIMLFLSFPRLI